MAYDIEDFTIARKFFVKNTGTTGHPHLNQAMKTLGGTFNRRDGGYYTFPDTARTEVEAIIANIQAITRPYTPAAPATDKPAAKPTQQSATSPRTGWSKAARRRAGHTITTSRHHPFGEVEEIGDGYTTYRDTAFGGGRVQIWDNS